MATLEGFQELDRKLMVLGSPKQIKGVARNAIRVGQRVVAKGIKSKIPGRYKDARKTVGDSLKAGKGENAGTVVAKVGMGVGKKRMSEGEAKGIAAARKAAGKRGVGIASNDVHWFVLGTDSRATGRKSVRVKGGKGKRVKVRTGNAIHDTGRMGAVLAGCVQAGVASSSGEAANKIKQNMADGIAKLSK